MMPDTARRFIADLDAVEPLDETPPEQPDPLDTVTRERDYLIARVQEQAVVIVEQGRLLRNITTAYANWPTLVAIQEARKYLDAGSESREAADAACPL